MTDGSSQPGEDPAAQVGPPPGYGAPPPGYGPPAGYGPGPAPSTAAGSSSSNVAGSTLWSLLAVVAIAVSVSVPENGSNGWKDIGVWAGFAIVAAAATLAPALRDNLKFNTERAWQVAAGGFVGLAAYWILFVLPAISQNVSFAATIGVAAAGLAVWSAPGRPSDGSSNSTGEWW